MELSLVPLIKQRMQDLGIARAELARRMGYVNIDKGCRRIAQICDGHLEVAERQRVALSRGLALGVEAVDRAIQATRAVQASAEDKAYRESFEPHAVIQTEDTVPSQIAVYAMTGGARHRIIRFDERSDQKTYAIQALSALPAVVPFLGPPIGFVVNYNPDFALWFNNKGRMVERLDRAVRVGRSSVTIGGKEVGERDLPASHCDVPPPKLLQQQIWEE